MEMEYVPTHLAGSIANQKAKQDWQTYRSSSNRNSKSWSTIAIPTGPCPTSEAQVPLSDEKMSLYNRLWQDHWTIRRYQATDKPATSLRWACSQRGLSAFQRCQAAADPATPTSNKSQHSLAGSEPHVTVQTFRDDDLCDLEWFSSLNIHIHPMTSSL